jgi:hypothetical protein
LGAPLFGEDVVEAKRTADGPKREFKNQHRPTAIVWRTLAELKPDPRNPRKHSQKQIRQIARSIEAFGFNVPVLIDRNLNVIAGHGR